MPRALATVEKVLSPTGVLMAEHRNIERVLDCLDAMAAETEAKGAIEVGPASSALEFLRTYADRLHHGKEEANLFPAMEARGLPADAGPTAVMREEHTAGRGLIRGMGEAVERRDASGFAAAAREYVDLLRHHIQKEDQILFPMADGLLLPAEQDSLREIFASVEAVDVGPETLGRMLAIAGTLAARYGVVEGRRAPASGGCGACCGH